MTNVELATALKEIADSLDGLTGMSALDDRAIVHNAQKIRDLAQEVDREQHGQAN